MNGVAQPHEPGIGCMRNIAGFGLGLLVIVALTGLTDYLMMAIIGPAATGPVADPPNTLILVAMVSYTAAYCCLGGYLAARIAKRGSRVTVVALAGAIFGLGLVYALLDPDAQPAWYLLAAPVLSGLACALGGGAHGAMGVKRWLTVHLANATAESAITRSGAGTGRLP